MPRVRHFGIVRKLIQSQDGVEHISEICLECQYASQNLAASHTFTLSCHETGEYESLMELHLNFSVQSNIKLEFAGVRFCVIEPNRIFVLLMSLHMS